MTEVHGGVDGDSAGPDGFAWPESVDPRAAAYIEGALGDASARNFAAWREHLIVPRVLRDVTQVSTEWHHDGRTSSAPIAIAPWASQTFVHPDGERATSRGAWAAGVPIVLSSNSATRVADLPGVDEGGAPFWSQLYVSPDRGDIVPYLEASKAAGALGFVVTVDAPTVPTDFPFRAPIRDIAPPSVNFAGGVMPAIAADLSLDDFRRIRETTGLPVLAKGVLSPADAAMLVDAGVDGVIVSNHGGRQLGGVVSTGAALPGVARAVAGRVPVWVDGGIRSGEDVFRAIALGADAVLVGRPAARALVDGAAGVEALVRRLRDELVTVMTMAGCTTLAEIDRSLLA
ncbi:alpha-hydroxy acid oxidase [Frondihabitans cladoniiphilus]|uniref:Lactate oxidase n=1 Tax=Frondihabitans cladoniiphilus TaxID=715785 RepID=A0ABP8VJU1_9MICO